MKIFLEVRGKRDVTRVGGSKRLRLGCEGIVGSVGILGYVLLGCGDFEVFRGRDGCGFIVLRI